MMFNNIINKFNKVSVILIAITIIWTIPTISRNFINSATSYQVSTDYKKQVECLAKNIYYEAGHESYEGKLAVAQVTMNRVNNPKYPKDVCSVVYQKSTNSVCQFSWTCIVNQMSSKNKYAWEEANYIASRALTQPIIHDTIYNTNALFYHAVYVNPGWNKSQVVTKIGNHIFYKNI